MNITIQRLSQSGSQVYDVTKYLITDRKTVLTVEREILAFQRTYADVSFTMSDLTGFWSTLFADASSTDVYGVEIWHNGTRRFWGHVDLESIEYDKVDLSVAFDVFDATKMFFERARTTKLGNLTVERGEYWNTTWVTLETFVTYHVNVTRIGEDLIYGLDLGDYATKYVRGCLYAPGPDDPSYPVPPYGRACDIHPDTTWDEFLRAVAIVWNAEWYIDPSSRNLTLRRRLAVVNDTQTDIDDLILDDLPLRVRYVDSERVDYIKTYTRTLFPAPTLAAFLTPTLPAMGIYGLDAGVHSYIVTAVHGATDQFMTARLDVTVPAGKWKVSIWVPQMFSDTESRRVYRKDFHDPAGYFRLVGTLAGSNAGYFEDEMPWSILQGVNSYLPAWPVGTATSWVRWTESGWETIIEKLRYGALFGDQPAGKILEVFPQMRFVQPEHPQVDVDDQRYATMLFFGGALSFNETFTQSIWRDWFRVRRGVTVAVKGLDFQLGDTVVSNKSYFPNDSTPDQRLLVRRVVADLVEEESELELVTL